MEGDRVAVYDSFEFTQSVLRKIPGHIRVIQALIYLFVVIFAVIGTMGGPLWLIPTLGTLFLSRLYMGAVRVTYVYRLQGAILSVQRISGPNSRQKAEDFAEFDLKRLQIMAPEGAQTLKSAEVAFQDSAHRIIYDVSAHDTKQVCSVMYLHDTKEDAGKMVKVCFQPEPELVSCIRRIAPDRTTGYEE